MKTSTVEDLFNRSYLSALQIGVKLADTQILLCELGRGSGKTTHIMSARMDRVQNSMPGSLITLGAATYRTIFDNILPGLLEYFNENYERGIYFEVGQKPPAHFKNCVSEQFNWKHSISFHNGTVIKFVSADRPESVLGISAVHSFWDELLKIKKSFMLERAMPILRADRSKFGLSPYFMGWSGFTSTPNFETDEDWFLETEKDMNKELIVCIQEIAYELDLRLQELELAQKTLDMDRINQLTRFVERWQERLTTLRKGQTCYIRASSFSNLKILGIDYIQNQIKSIKDLDMLYTSIFAIRKLKVKDMFFGSFGKQHLFDDGYDYRYIDRIAAGEKVSDSCIHLSYYDKKQPLYAGYDPGPFQSIVFAQRNRKDKVFRVIKNFWVYHPEQQDVLAKKIDDFFEGGRKEIILHYDRAANQRDPEWRKFYPAYRDMGVNDTDAIMLKRELTALGWNVIMMSKDQKIIYYQQQYRLLNLLFGKYDGKRDRILIDRNECEALVSSINHSPLKRHEGRTMLDKSSEKLPFNEQAYNSTQLASAAIYLLWGEYGKLLPDSDQSGQTPQGAGTYTT